MTLKQLQKQATKEVWGNNPYNGSPEFEGYEIDQDLFAKLIIDAASNYAAEYFNDANLQRDLYIHEYVKSQFEMEQS